MTKSLQKSKSLFFLAVIMHFSFLAYSQSKVTVQSIVNWMQAKDYPVSIFIDLEEQGFVFKESSDVSLNRKEYVYKSKDNNSESGYFIMVKHGESGPLPKEYHDIHIQAFKKLKPSLDVLIKQIKETSKFEGTWEYFREDAEITVTNYVYKHPSGIYFYYNNCLLKQIGGVVSDLYIINYKLNIELKK